MGDKIEEGIEAIQEALQREMEEELAQEAEEFLNKAQKWNEGDNTNKNKIATAQIKEEKITTKKETQFDTAKHKR
eukprot:10818561-Ditylum_brightwellii.AAC.1